MTRQVQVHLASHYESDNTVIPLYVVSIGHNNTYSQIYYLSHTARP